MYNTVTFISLLIHTTIAKEIHILAKGVPGLGLHRKTQMVYGSADY